MNMKKYIVGLVLVSSFFVSTPVMAAGLTEDQIQSIISILTAFGADSFTVSDVNAVLHGQAVLNMATSSAPCITLNNNLYADTTDATTDGEVSKLQQFLGGRVTGYFGPVTLQLVQNWQATHGIVSSGSPDTTGYGYAGTKTRTSMNCANNQVSNTNFATPSQSNNPHIQTATTTTATSTISTATSTPSGAVPAIPAVPAVPATSATPAVPATPITPAVPATPAIPAVPATPAVPEQTATTTAATTTRTITATAGTGGSISPAGSVLVTQGTNKTFTIAANAGYTISTTTVDGVNQGAISTYTFTNVQTTHTISATFSLIPVAQSCSLTVSIAQTTPAAQTISPGQNAVTLVKFNATSNCDGTLKSFAVSLLPMPNGYQNISTIRLYDDVSGVQLGTTQNVTIAGMNFPSVNTPLTANQAMVLKVVGDVSTSAVNGSTVYGVFGGSWAVNGSGGTVGNNASGNIIAGNAMAVQTAPDLTPDPTSACPGGSGRVSGLPNCLMPENLTGTAWNEVDNATGRVLNTAVCSVDVCGRNGEWREARNMNGTYYPNGYPPNSTYIQTPFDAGRGGQYYTNGVWQTGGGEIFQPGSSRISYVAPTSINQSSFSRNLTIGSIGEDVKRLQTLLAREVNYSADLITGYFGRITSSAVKKLQEKYGVIPASGYFGEITRKALTASVANW